MILIRTTSSYLLLIAGVWFVFEAALIIFGFDLLDWNYSAALIFNFLSDKLLSPLPVATDHSFITVFLLVVAGLHLSIANSFGYRSLLTFSRYIDFFWYTGGAVFAAAAIISLKASTVEFSWSGLSTLRGTAAQIAGDVQRSGNFGSCEEVRDWPNLNQSKISNGGVAIAPDGTRIVDFGRNGLTYTFDTLNTEVTISRGDTVIEKIKQPGDVSFSAMTVAASCLGMDVALEHRVDLHAVCMSSSVQEIAASFEKYRFADNVVRTMNKSTPHVILTDVCYAARVLGAFRSAGIFADGLSGQVAELAQALEVGWQQDDLSELQTSIFGVEQVRFNYLLAVLLALKILKTSLSVIPPKRSEQIA